MTSLEIIADRPNHKLVAQTAPRKWEGKGTVHYQTWDDGVVTSYYAYGDGTSTTLNIVDVAFFENNVRPQWLPV